MRVSMRSTEADQLVLVMKLGNSSGAKGLNCSADAMSQLMMGGTHVISETVCHRQTSCMAGL